jgi:hypothetical protein
MTKQIIFDPNHLIKLISEFDYLNNFDDSKIIEEICEYCGVSWGSHAIKVPADVLGEILSPSQAQALGTFQMNLVHFFEHFDGFLNIKLTAFKSQVFINSLKKDFQKRAISVFQLMTRNFIKNLLETANNSKSNENNLIENLCSGDLEKTLKFVPSRDLARQLGISDQKLRREIYLARQRALKKRPTPKIYLEKDLTSSTTTSTITAARTEAAEIPEITSSSLVSDIVPKDLKNVDESKFEEYFNLEIPTCASPISDMPSHDDNDGKKLNFNGQDEEMIDEWSIESLIRSDFYES